MSRIGEAGSRSSSGMTFVADRPYNALPPLPPRAEVETRAVLKACIAARAALAERRMAGRLIPNQAVLINAIPLLEAQASTEIENIVTTANRLFRFAGDDSVADAATKEALRYRTALHEGFRMLSRRPVSTATAVAVCRIIKGVELDIRATPVSPRQPHPALRGPPLRGALLRATGERVAAVPGVGHIPSPASRPGKDVRALPRLRLL